MSDLLGLVRFLWFFNTLYQHDRQSRCERRRLEECYRQQGRHGVDHDSTSLHCPMLALSNPTRKQPHRITSTDLHQSHQLRRTNHIILVALHLSLFSPRIDLATTTAIHSCMGSSVNEPLLQPSYKARLHHASHPQVHQVQSVHQV